MKHYIRKIDKLEEKERRLLVALHDAIRRPMGVVPESADEFYSQAMSEEAERNRPRVSCDTGKKQ